jgi:hypothetical protein
MVQLTISTFTDRATGNAVLTQTMDKGIVKICVKQTVQTKAQPGWIGGKPRTLVGWIKILPEQFAELEQHITEGADFNSIPGVDALQLYTQLSFQPFYSGQKGAQKYGANNKLVPSLIDGKPYYAQTAFAFADVELPSLRVWGRVADKKFVADASVRDAQSAPAKVAEGEF